MSDIASEVRDGICIIRVGKAPDGLMTGEMCVAAEGLVDDAANDPAVRVIIFTGELPGVFIEHFSVVEIEDRTRALQQRGWNVDKGLPFDDRPQDRMMSKIESMSKPVIAAINGTCMGFGYELALCCDIRVARQGSYSIGLPEANIGIFPGAGGTQRLPRLVGPARALEMLLLGSTFMLDEAKAAGLVGSVVVDALDTAIAFPRKIMSRPLAQSGHLKRLVRSACDMQIDEGRKLERLLSADIATSEEGLAVLARFNRPNGDIRDNHCQ